MPEKKTTNSIHEEHRARMQERVARELGFTLVGHRLELYGVPLPKKKGTARQD